MTRTMKDSGIEWIGKIPEDWNYVPLKAYYEFEKGKNAALYTQEYIGENEGPYPVYSGQTQDEGIMGRVNSYDYDIKKCLFTTTVGAKVMTPKILTGRFCLSQNCLIMKQIQQVYDNFIYYLLIPLFDYYKSLIPTYMQPSLRIEDLKSYRFYLPSMPEQQKIADFLDKKCSHIDSILEKTKASIDECKQLKQSVITQAVTKGIRPNRPMKDSGIEWIGKIPEDWKIKKLKYSCSNRNENYSSNYGALEYFALENIESKSAKFIHTENVYDITQSQICKENDVVFGKLRPYLAKVYQVPTLCCCSGEFAVFCDFEGVADYYKYIMLSHWFINIVDASTYGTKMPRANIQFIKNMDITVPSKTEQIEIVSYLDKKCTEIDKLITKKEKLIEELETYKKSLIYEYVTGKKEVI